MKSKDTTVTIPRDLFEKLKILAAREHRSARGQVVQLLTIATADIELPPLAATQEENDNWFEKQEAARQAFEALLNNNK